MLSCGEGIVCLTVVTNDSTTLEERGDETEICCPVGREECVTAVSNDTTSERERR